MTAASLTARIERAEEKETAPVSASKPAQKIAADRIT
jgi:hypothetical protein